MDVSNICRLFNAIGEKSFWDPEAINRHLTSEGSSGITATTLHMRIKSLQRFLRFLETYRNVILPHGRSLNRFKLILNGVEKSFLKERNSHQQVVMANNRRNYNHTLDVLKLWSSKRHDFLKIFSDVELDENRYNLMRNFLISELVIPNGQRAGIIPGLVREEVEAADSNFADNGFYIIMVADHKTGFLQSASIFLYPSVFNALKYFIREILPKIPYYISNKDSLDNSSPIFVKYSGDRGTSSMVTPITRTALRNMGIEFTGTITDFRRASATLTGKYNPLLAEKMSQLMGHSRRIHDKHYRIQCGHHGLLNAYKQLEILHSSPFSNSSNLNNFDGLLNSRLPANLPTNSKSTIDEHSETDRDFYSHSFNNFLSDSQENSTVTGNNFSPPVDEDFGKVCNSTMVEFNSDPKSLDTVSRCSFDNTQLNSIPQNPPSVSIADVMHSSGIFTTHSSNESFENSIFTSDVGIHGNQIVQPIPTHHNVGENAHLKECCIYFDSMCSLVNHKGKSLQHKSIFLNREHEKIFEAFFDTEITRVRNLLPISKVAVFNKANTKEFSPVLQNIRGNSLLKIYNRVRTLGNIQRSPKFNNTTSRENLTFGRCLFKLKSDEDLFKLIFDQLIKRIRQRNPVARNEIMHIANNNLLFIPLLEKLRDYYPFDNIDNKIVNKVRSLGNYKY